MATHVRKVTLAIADEEYAWAERRAKRTGTSVSAVLSAAAREKRQAEERDEKQRRAWTALLAHVVADVPLAYEELRSAGEELDGAVERPRQLAAPRHPPARAVRLRRGPSGT